MAATASTKLSSDSPISLFISIAMRGLEPKLRIKIPNSLLKTMHKKFRIILRKDTDIANDGDNRSTRRAKDKSQLRHKAASLFSTAFANKKSPGKTSGLTSKDGKEVSTNNLMHVDLPVLAAILSAPDSPLLSFPDKKNVCSLIKAKMKKTREVDRSKDTKVRRKRNFGSRPLVTVKKLKIITKSLQKKVKKRFARDNENGEEDEGELLWKKRILMGGRCKPLKDDEDSLSLPEILFSAQ